MKEEGQATVEFALTMALVLAFILFFVQLSFVFAWGNYVHYATFMSARAFLASSYDRDGQKARAKSYLTQMLKRGESATGQDRFPTIAKGIEGEGDVKGLSFAEWDGGSPDYSWEEGVRYKFRSRIFVIPLGRAKAGGPDESVNSVTLTSESLLGREPTFKECQDFMDDNKNGWIFDNGC